jgi:integrase
MLPTVTDVLEFLYSLYEHELSYSTINTARSALTSYLMNTNLRDTPYTVSTHPFINRFMKGVFNSRKPTPKYSETWDVNIVLGFIKKWYPLNTLSLKDLTYKLVILLALTTGQRCQTLVSLNTQTMTKTVKHYVFHLNDHVKQNRPGYVFSTVFVRRYHQQEVCVYRTLEHYLDRTAAIRRSNKLFVSVVKPHDKISTNTLSRWIKTLLTLSGIDTTKFKAHSTRAACASKASNSLPIDVILNHVGWASDCVFRKYYDKPIVREGVFENAVLQ